MADNNQEIKEINNKEVGEKAKRQPTLKQEVQKLRNSLARMQKDIVTKNEKIAELQNDIVELNKSIKKTQIEYEEKEAQLKKVEYTSVLDKLDDAAFNTLTIREAEVLVQKILSGSLSALLCESEDVATNSNEDNIDNNDNSNIDTE